MNEKDALIEITDSENVSDAHDTLEEYACDESFVHPMRPEYVVKPKDAEQVKGIVSIVLKTF